MKKYIIRHDSVYALISLLSLLYVNYYQTILYYKKITALSYIFDNIYEYIAIPLFYCFITAFVASVILDFFRVNIPKTFHKISKYIICLFLVLYIIFLVIKTKWIIMIPPIGFTSIYSIVFSVFGCLFALYTQKIKMT